VADLDFTAEAAPDPRDYVMGGDAGWLVIKDDAAHGRGKRH
jgi:hypothetical protein